jgi:hypothetical protein
MVLTLPFLILAFVNSAIGMGEVSPICPPFGFRFRAA